MLGTEFGPAKKAGRFVYSISENGNTVAIASATFYSVFICQLLVDLQVKDVLIATGKNQSILYESKTYVGLEFYNTISEDELIKLLSTKRVPRTLP